MFDDPPTELQTLILTCAVLPWFDAALLSPHARRPRLVRELLAGALVEPLEAAPHLLRLRDEVQAAAADWIQAHPRFDELQIRTQAFGDLIARLRDAPADADWHRVAEHSLFHLDRMFFLLAPRGEWQAIGRYTAQARAIEDLPPAYRHQLAFYDGSVALNSQQYDRAEASFDALLQEPDLSAQARVRVLNALALSHMYQSAYSTALELFEQAHALAQDIADRFYQAAALSNMGMIYIDLDYHERALELNRQSLAIFRGMQDHRREAVVLYEIGNIALHLGRWQVAEEHYALALDLCEQFGMHSRLGNLYWAQGLLYLLLGDASRSEAAYLRALEITQSPEHGDQRVANDVFWQLGFFYATQGHWDRALEMYQQVIDQARALRRTHWLSMMQYQLGSVFERQGRLHDAYAIYAQAIDGIEALGGTTEREEIKIGLLGTTQQMYEAMVLLCLELGREAEAFGYVERARSRAFLDSLAKKSPELSATLDHPVVTLADVQAQLPAGAVLLEYYTTGVLPRGEHMINSLPESNARLREYLTLPPAIMLFAITRDRFEVYRPALNPNSLRPPLGDRYPGRHLLHGRLPQQLYERLLAPASELLHGCEVLYLVPHGPLHYVPFTALRSAAGQYLLHAAGPALAHAPSATILLRNCLGRPKATGSALLALGFNDPHGEQPLRYAEAEANHIARLFGGEAWTGLEPKSQRLIAAGRNIRWLHIAGHARFDPLDPLGSSLYLGAGDALSARDIIRDLDLATELVMLSSCTSGVSHVVPGDELLGLQRALLYAGAPTVVCTRWEARDLVALLIMDRFYTSFLQGQSPAVALRDAQVGVREMTSFDLAMQIERWRAETAELADALGAPAEALREIQTATRELHDIDFAPILNSWRTEAIELVRASGQPPGPLSIGGAHPFADPLLWAPFMLVGRA